MLIICLLGQGYTLDELASHSRKSRRTVQYKLTKFGISLRQETTEIEDDELDELIAQVIVSAPNLGKHFFFVYDRHM